MFACSGGKTAPIMVDVKLDSKELKMELDTGAAVSLISEATYKQLWSERGPRITPTNETLRGYAGDKLCVLGKLEVNVEVPVSAEPSKRFRLPLFVVGGSGHNLFGRDWLQQVRLDWSGLMGPVLSVQRPDSGNTLQEILRKQSAVFSEGLGEYVGPAVKIAVDPQVVPKFCAARPVPYAWRDAVGKALTTMEEKGIIEPVNHANWASPIVPVMKPDGSVRICGDYKRTLNKACLVDQYPLPRIEDMFPVMAGGQKFTKIDLTQAYLQLTLAEESREYTTINTPKGLYQFKRLPFGVASATAIFQRTIEGILKGMPFTVVRVDDILVSGMDDMDHLQNVDEVLQRLERAGLRAKREKCDFFMPEVIYMGYIVDRLGHRPNPEKVKAILEAPVPRNAQELKSYLGMLQYYGRFLKDLSTSLEPLHLLLRKSQPWRWSREQQHAFEETKQRLCSTELLAHYQPDLPLHLFCDASPYGVGAVLSHTFRDGSERPIAYASRALSAAERNYAQLDKEALAIAFGVKKFHNYVCGRLVTIWTDHKPLLGLLGQEKAIPGQASGRLIRWAIMLQGYKYELRYRSGGRHQNADCLSRLPLEPGVANPPTPGENILVMDMFNQSPVTADMVAQWTKKDPVLARVERLVAQGWSSNPQSELLAYARVKDELSLQSGCVLRGARVVIPEAGRKALLQDLHREHPGMTRMKGLARSYMWWPKMDGDIETWV